jgi:CubicO group peptidase (beta-lactamase class C family)
MKLFKIIFMVLIISINNSCLSEDALKLPFQSFIPQDIFDGWTISNPTEENIESIRLKEIYTDLHENEIWQIKSLLVFRNGKLVAESYIKDPNEIINRTAVWSCTKQFTAILAGIAVDQRLFDVDDPISKYLPQSVSYGKGHISIGNLLTMRSGINFNNDGFNGETSQLLREEPGNSLDFILGLNMRSGPGSSFYYNDGDPQLISAIIQTQTNEAMHLWAEKVLFSKIGITNLQWLSYKDGMTMGAFGILTTPREMAKLGQLVMNNGLWNDEQIVSSAWINESTQEKISANETHETNITFG